MFSLERGIDVYATAVGSGDSMQVSMLMRFYHLSYSDIYRMDEMQIANRIADLPKILSMERRHLALAFWGAKKGGSDGEETTDRGSRRRR